ncbi:MAG TPA: enoyl-CoA hydratase/isomerase family protein [Dehalococcoidia bacterium]|nr:enoyl-CoA hydratase/isomerase family protein [Dehalococcoidia bacterium]
MFQAIRYEKGGGVARITLDRPQRHNAIDLPMRDELWQALQALQDDPDVRCALFQGAGDEAFSSGADLQDFGSAPSVLQARAARQQRDLWGFLLTLEKPLVAAIRGYTWGAGLELALLCDIRVAAEDASLCLPEVGLGYISSAGGSQLLPRTILPGPALELLLTGRPIGAERALELGLVQRVFPAERLLVEAESLATRLANLSPAAAAAARRALLAALDLPLAQGLAFEAQISCRLAIVA